MQISLKLVAASNTEAFRKAFKLSKLLLHEFFNFRKFPPLNNLTSKASFCSEVSKLHRHRTRKKTISKDESWRNFNHCFCHWNSSKSQAESNFVIFQPELRLISLLINLLTSTFCRVHCARKLFADWKELLPLTRRFSCLIYAKLSLDAINYGFPAENVSLWSLLSDQQWKVFFPTVVSSFNAGERELSQLCWRSKGFRKFFLGFNESRRLKFLLKEASHKKFPSWRCFKHFESSAKSFAKQFPLQFCHFR